MCLIFVICAILTVKSMCLIIRPCQTKGGEPDETLDSGQVAGRPALRRDRRRVLVNAAGAGADRVKLTHNCNDVPIFFLVVIYTYIVNVTYREFIEVHYTYVLIERDYKKS